MNIVILSGSPHRHGTSAMLADRFTEGARDAGHTVIRFDTAFMDIHPCVACNTCRRPAGTPCVFRDDMTGIGNAVAKADCVVLATPIYYFNICAQLKTAFDRFFGLEHIIRRGQKCAFITTMADDAPTLANEWYRVTAAWLGWKDIGILNAEGCLTVEDMLKTDYPERAYAFGKSL